MKGTSVFLAAAAMLYALGCRSNTDPRMGGIKTFLTSDQCEYLDDDEAQKVRICHHTSSAKNPFVIIQTSTDACIEGHASHEQDYITSTNPEDETYDPTCSGLGCYPEGAPWDATVPCCEGLEAGSDGRCANVDACVHYPCGDNASCQDLPPPSPDSTEGRSCTCHIGFEEDGSGACVDIDACATSPCSANATCSDIPAPDPGTGFICTCNTGYEDDGAGGCADIDPCVTNPCVINATCTDIPAPDPGTGFICSCNTGYEDDGAGGCADIDPCVTNPCVINATCTDIPAPDPGTGFICSCNIGYEENGTGACVDVDACVTSPCSVNATCTDIPAPDPGTGFICTCNTGYEEGEAGICTDIDACATDPCDTNATCTDIAAPDPGSGFTCACNTGYEEDGTGACVDIDACASDPCSANATCTDLPAPDPGSGFSCTCNTGYEDDGAGACTDIDACATGPCDTNATCADIPAPDPGSGFSCTCNTGYEDDGAGACTDINGCATDPCGTNATCTDIPAPDPGTGFSCTCNIGYEDDGAGTCFDIDACAASTGFTTLDDGLLGHWPLSGDAMDVSGNGLHGSVSGASPATDRYGNANSAMMFTDSTHEIVILDDGTLSGMDQLTVCAWIKPTAPVYGASVVNKRLADDHNDATDAYELSVPNTLGDRIYGGVCTSSYPGCVGAQSETVMTYDGTWFHVCERYDGTMISLIIDGEVEGTTPVTGAIQSNPQVPLKIGNASDANGCGTPADFCHFNGVLDDVRIWNRALSTEEIVCAADVDACAANPCGPNSICTDIPAPDPGTGFSCACDIGYEDDGTGACVLEIPECPAPDVGHWRFDNGSGSTAYDSTAHANHGTIHGTTWATGRSGSGLYFDGDYDWVEVPFSPVFNVTRLTIALWVNIDGFSSWNYYLVSRHPGNQYHSYNMFISSNGNVYGHWQLGQDNDSLVYGNPSLSPGGWRHLVFTYDGAVMSLYADGTLLAQAPNTADPPSTSVPIRIGRAHTFDTEFMKGYLDEVAIYGYAMTAEEVATLYACYGP